MAAGRGEQDQKRSSRTDSYHSDSEEEIEEEPNFSDSEDFVDDVTDEELVGDVLKKCPKETDGMDSVVVVDNVPQVGQDRVEKLKSVLRKIFVRFGKIVAEHYPEENGTTKGYVFIEYSSPQHALEAVKHANHYKLDKSHIFLVNLFSDFDRFHDVDEDYEEPRKRPFQDPGDLKAWLASRECYDQFSVIYEGGDQTAIFLNSPEPTILDKRYRWTETYVRWSPKGSFLATCHSKGIALWGGEDFTQKSKFNHNRVQLLDFSPCEKYLVTLNNSAPNMEDAIIVWDIRTGHKKRSFSSEQEVTWPIFKWNHDGTFFARIGQDAISVYETPSFGLLGKKSIKITEVRDFTWSPTDNIIAYWVPEEENTPARVTLIEIPSRQEVCVRNLFNVADCKMQWQQNGDYLCVKVDRYSKARKVEEKNQYKYSGIYVNFEIFRIREKQIPVDKVEVKENVLAFAWEPVGSRFAYIHGEAPRICVSFHNVANTGKVDQLKTFEKRTANHLFWSPTGQFIVLAGLRSMNGVLEFIDTNDMTVMNQTEHFMATDVEWDPTGRYVVSAVSWWGHKVDNAFWIWSFQGNLLQKVPMERFCQLLWRPRPKILLTDVQIKQVKKNFKTYAQKFEVEDSLRKKTASKEMLEKRKKMFEDHQEYRLAKKAEFKKRKKERMALRNGADTDELHSHEENFCEEVVEFLISVEETLVE